MAQAGAAEAGITTVPSPMGGVNFYDSLFGMPPEDAISLINWWPEVYGCSHRKGYVHWAAGIGDTVVGSLYTYHTSHGESMLFAFTGTDPDAAMYDVTSKDTASPPDARTPVVTGLSTSIWQATMFATSGGTQKVFVSGQDQPIWLHQTAPPLVIYDRLSSGDGIVAGTIAGDTTTVPPTPNPNVNSFVDVTIHQRRMWFVEKDSTRGWYLPNDSVWGLARFFDFGPLFKRGGYLQSLATWTVDDGDGSNDLLVAFGSEGDVAVYGGTDVDTADAWTLQGVYYAGAPIAGHRFHCKVNGDLKFLTQKGIVSMNNMLTSSRVTSPATTVDTQKVQRFLAEQAGLFGFLEGWDVKYIAAINMVLINIPGLTLEGDVQVALNVVNGKFTLFRGMDISCICPDYQDIFFFGNSQGHILQGWTGNADHVNSISDPAGYPITAVVQQAYNYFGTPANNKQVGLFRPNFLTDRSVVWKGNIVYDFSFFAPVVQQNPLQSPLPRWDQAIWDAAYWSGGLHAQKQWASASGYGFAGSLCMASRSDGEVLWVNTDFTIRSGGIL